MRQKLPQVLVLCTAFGLSLTGCRGEGHSIYLEAGCPECHGEDLRGTPTSGPAIKNTRRHWDVERMLIYFRNPDSVASLDPRLSELRSLYGEGMAPLKLTDPIAREKLAEYVIR